MERILIKIIHQKNKIKIRKRVMKNRNKKNQIMINKIYEIFIINVNLIL